MIIADSKAPGGERTKLLDFGIAKLADEGSPGAGPARVKTKTNSLMGTPYYMSPEQCRGAGKVDARSDVYALGVMLYEMLSGVRPISGEGQGDIIVKHLTEEPTPLRSRVPDLPEAVAALVHRMMIKDREKRPAMQEVAAELEALSAAFPPRTTRRSTANIPLVTGPQTAPEPVRTGVGTAAGQTSAPKMRQLGMGIGIAAGVALLGFAVLGVRALQKTPVTPPQASAVPKNIRWSVESTPPGAEVVQASDGQVLGKTPWISDRPPQAGSLKLKLRLDGHSEKEIELSQSTDALYKETLAPLPPVEPQAESGKKLESGKGGKSSSKTPGGSGKGKKGKSAKTRKGGRQIED